MSGKPGQVHRLTGKGLGTPRSPAIIFTQEPLTTLPCSLYAAARLLAGLLDGPLAYASEDITPGAFAEVVALPERPVRFPSRRHLLGLDFYQLEDVCRLRPSEWLTPAGTGISPAEGAGLLPSNLLYIRSATAVVWHLHCSNPPFPPGAVTVHIRFSFACSPPGSDISRCHHVRRGQTPIGLTGTIVRRPSSTG